MERNNQGGAMVQLLLPSIYFDAFYRFFFACRFNVFLSMQIIGFFSFVFFMLNIYMYICGIRLLLLNFFQYISHFDKYNQNNSTVYFMPRQVSIILCIDEEQADFLKDNQMHSWKIHCRVVDMLIGVWCKINFILDAQ